MKNKSYLEINIDDIIAWCKENNQVEWLKAEAAKKVEVEHYSKRVKVWSEEKQKNVYVADKTSPKVIKEQPISFVQLKKNFCEKFMPEKLPTAKEKEPTMFDKINAL